MKRILYAKAVFDNKEVDAVVKSLKSNWLAAGPIVAKFESRVAKLFNKKYALATNSGSSANLLAITALNLPKGSEVITPACTFATTVAPLIQNNLIPVFVDVEIGRYTIDEDKIRAAITDKTSALMVPHLIGSVVDLIKIRKIADEFNLKVIDDSCDTIGSYPYVGLSDLTTTSFYGSHVITTMGSGGMVMTDDEEILKRLKSLVNWGRVGSDNEIFDERFNFKLEGIPYDEKFIYSGIGFNFKMTEPQAAFGLVQLDKLDGFKEIRQRNHKRLYDYFAKYKDWFYLPESIPTTWMAFALTVKDAAPFNRYEFLKYLDDSDIQVRVLFSGNITKHPIYKKDVDYRVAGSLASSNKVMESGLLIGCHHGLTDSDIDYVIEVMDQYLNDK